MLELVNFLETAYNLQLESRLWRNQDNVATYFKIKHIDDITHKAWLQSLTQKKPCNIAFFIKFKNEYVGVTYFHSINYQDKLGDWGIYLHKEAFRGQGIGKQTLKQCIEFAKNVLHLEMLFLDVLRSNTIAVKAYEANGFILIKQEKNGFLKYKRNI